MLKGKCSVKVLCAEKTQNIKALKTSIKMQERRLRTLIDVFYDILLELREMKAEFMRLSAMIRRLLAKYLQE